MSERRFLVTGATGTTGQFVTAGLRSRGCVAVAASRRPDPGDDDAIEFDWADSTTFGPALQRTDGVYLIAPTGADHPAELVRPFLELAADLEVPRVVLLSSSAVRRGDPGLGEIHDRAMNLIPGTTVLRPSWFMQNFVGNHPLAEGIRLYHTIFTATGDGRLGFIDASDIARVAVQVLTGSSATPGELTLTGPESMSYPGVATVISELIGHSVRCVDISTDELVERHVAAGTPLEFAISLSTLDAQIRRGEQDFVTSTVYELTGQQPNSLRDFLATYLKQQG